MKYMLLVYGAENCWTDAEREACMVDSLKICDRLAAKGKYLAASPLQPAATAATVRVRDGRTLVTDGPFAETTEQLGGYFLLDLADLDEAIAVAAELPPAAKGVVEIRPLLPLDGVPPGRPHPDGGTSPQAYLFLCYDDEAAWMKVGAEALKQAMAEAVALTRDLDAADRFVTASPLHPAVTATNVRVRDGKRVITDGPYAETHEVLGGFYVVLAESKAEALRAAERHPGARIGSVEVRPLFDLSGIRKSMANS